MIGKLFFQRQSSTTLELEQEAELKQKEHKCRRALMCLKPFIKCSYQLKKYMCKLSVKDYLHLALASMSVMSLSPNCYPGKVRPLFNFEKKKKKKMQSFCVLQKLFEYLVHGEQHGRSNNWSRHQVLRVSLFYF